VSDEPVSANPFANVRELDRRRSLLWGWGRTAPTTSDLVLPHDPEDVRAAVLAAGRRGVLARGLGRGYGDCAQNSGGTVVDGPSLSGLLEVDLEQHCIRALAGTSLDDLMRWLVPLGMFVPVTPGTRTVTIGGAIAADIHGKNHHVKGSWGNHVESFRLVDGSGRVRDVSPESDHDLFWATMGGMGLTGVVVDATIRMQPVESSQLVVDTDRTADLDEVMSLMVEGDDRYDYSVAWIDILARGSSMGRSILDRGRFATRDEALAGGAADPLDYATHQLPSVPDVFPPGVINTLFCRAFNELWYRKAPRQRRDALLSIEQFFHPLDMVSDWNRAYGRRGFFQWQYAVPDEASEFVRTSLERLSAAGVPSFLAVLKRFGPGNAGHLSFPAKGWTLAFDTAVEPGMERLFDELDEQVVELGGRIYLAKDSRVRPELIPQMYPRLDEWRKIRAEVDPEERFRSDMSRRLHLV
jgi:decaprenylphospho-beta-D-ribofuranose 2-oxidase